MARPVENTKLDQFNAVEKYNSGYSVTRISKESGKAVGTVTRYLQEKGVEIKGKFGNKHKKSCLHCHKMFMGKSHQKYCSKKCVVTVCNNNKKKDIPQYLMTKVEQAIQNKYKRMGTKTPCSITPEWIKDRLNKQNYKCAITGVQMVSPASGKDIRAYSIDRIDSSKGYLKTNCQIICLGVQYMKHTFTQEQVHDFLCEAFKQTL